MYIAHSWGNPARRKKNQDSPKFRGYWFITLADMPTFTQWRIQVGGNLLPPNRKKSVQKCFFLTEFLDMRAQKKGINLQNFWIPPPKWTKNSISEILGAMQQSPLETALEFSIKWNRKWVNNSLVLINDDSIYCLWLTEPTNHWILSSKAPGVD